MATKETKMSETTQAQAPAADKRPQLPEVEHVFDTKEQLDAGSKDATAKGYNRYATRKFEVVVGNKKLYVMAYNVKDAAGRAAQSGKAGIEVVELDAAARTVGVRKVAPNADSVISAMGMLSDEDRKRVEAAIAEAKKAAKK